MSQVLQRVKREFEDRGFSDETQIAEHISFLLLLRHEREDSWANINWTNEDEVNRYLDRLYRELQQRYSTLQIPLPPTGPAPGWWIRRIIGMLVEAPARSVTGTSLGPFFQREVRYELLKSTAGSQYPTPYHIADFIAALAVTGLGEAVAVCDPTAGSGGLLVAASKYARNAFLTGHDFSPVWARLGSTNLLLHDVTAATFGVGLALDLYYDYPEYFDSVVMNPPFGGNRGLEEVKLTIGSQYGRSNPAVLAALVLHLLKPGGWGAFLVPTGILFGGSGEAEVRALLTDNDLQAIITLPRDAFQPHSHVEAHLVIIQKRILDVRDDAAPAGKAGSASEEGERQDPARALGEGSEEQDKVSASPGANGSEGQNRAGSSTGVEDHPTNSVWFCKIDRDGYPPGAGRDLTSPLDPLSNELPRVKALLLADRRNEWTSHLVLENGPVIQALQLLPSDGLPAVAVRLAGPDSDLRWEVIKLPSGILAHCRRTNRELVAWVFVPYQGETVAGHAESIRQFSWIRDIPAQRWTPSLPERWTGTVEGVDAVIETNDVQSLLLTKGRVNYRFDPNIEGPSIACLLDADGTPLSPWLQLTNQGRQGFTPEDFGADWGATQVRDASDAVIGWLIALSSVTGDGDGVQQATLMILNVHEGALFSNPADASTAFAWLDGGWLRVQQTESPFIKPETGESVRLRRDKAAQGFAIGPAPLGVEDGNSGLFGVLMPRSEFEERGKDVYRVRELEPRHFLPEPPPPPVAHPSDVIANIRRNQTTLGRRIDTLLHVLGAARGRETESALADDKGILSLLDAEQQQLLELLNQRTNRGAKRFNLADLTSWLSDAGSAATPDLSRQQLDLFVRLGLVLEVHFSENNLYRLAVAGDVIRAARSTDAP